MKYDVTHYTLTFKENLEHDWVWGCHTVKGLTLQTDSTLRSPSVLKARDQWALDNLDYERELLREKGLYHGEWDCKK